MVNIDLNNQIWITRGDTGSFPLFLNAGNDLYPIRYEFQLEDEVYLGVMEPNQPFENAILKKKFTFNDLNDDGDIVVKFKHDDTKCLLPGKYFYQIKAKFINKETNEFEVHTVVQKTQFIIEE